MHDEDESGRYFAGVKMNDQNLPMNELLAKQKEISRLPSKEAQVAAFSKMREDGLLMTERLKIGKDEDKASILKMKDAKGKVRIELKVEAGGNPRMTFFDERGRVVYSLPPGAAKSF